MNFRWLLTLIITIFSAILFAFVPAFNWFGARKISLFEQFAAQGEVLQFLWHLLMPSMLIFLGLLFIFIIKAPIQKSEEDNSINKD